MIRFYNREEDCLLRGTDWIYNHNSDHSSGFPSFLSGLEQTLSSVGTQNGSHVPFIKFWSQFSPKAALRTWPKFRHHAALQTQTPPNRSASPLAANCQQSNPPARCLLHFILLPAYLHQDEQVLPGDYQSGQFSVSQNNNNNNKLNT